MGSSPVAGVLLETVAQNVSQNRKLDETGI
jgi:hypothetical protein